ncbi:MAG: transposase, partial [Bacillota bacterium]|nr:transposase [Bacillota bacterium]
MSKYSYEFKKKVVEEYLQGKGGYKYLAKKHHVSSYSCIKRWVNAYKQLGDEGLKRSRTKNKYTFEFKLYMVELYLSSEVSYQDLALSQGINNPALITRWVQDFRVAGLDALRPKKKGRKKTLKQAENYKKQTSLPDERVVDTSVEHVKELEDEL